MYSEQSDHEKKNRIIYFSNENIIKYQKKMLYFCNLSDFKNSDGNAWEKLKWKTKKTSSNVKCLHLYRQFWFGEYK